MGEGCRLEDIYIYVYLHVCICIFISMYRIIHACIIYARIQTRIYTRVYMCAYTHIYMHACARVKFTRASICTYTCAHTRMCVRAYIIYVTVYALTRVYAHVYYMSHLYPHKRAYKCVLIVLKGYHWSKGVVVLLQLLFLIILHQTPSGTNSSHPEASGKQQQASRSHHGRTTSI